MTVLDNIVRTITEMREFGFNFAKEEKQNKQNSFHFRA